ncbi:gliding motility-associated C-terminal domain-containing protein [Aquimarina algiphila]|uniref:T9SS type B sorting domain-containing protein n=1 Tax=Aquimarina algiphila TaxID=2047982 RepID=UPI00248F834D|nr:gliding motility-associated C-terminal domain-containing protein [Aquimarina algiphila]
MGNTSKNVFTTKLKLNLVGLILIFNASISFGQGCPEVPISGIDETQRFSVAGNNIEDDLGESVSKAGDINGDGISDIIIGAPGVDNGSLEEVGEVYVIFGANSITTSSIDINALNGSNGFIVRGVNSSERIGVVVSSAGDINDDGIDDILIGSNGKAIVIFGSTSRFSSTYLTTDINGVNGVILEDTASNTGFGQTLSNVGDINNDGVDDIIIGASNSSGSGISQIGNAYVFYGSSAIGSMNVSILNGSNGFKIEGFLQNRSGGGLKVSNAGDINDDGLSDVIIGYPSYEEGTAAGAGRVALVFGSITGFLPVLSLSSLDGSNGFIMTGNVRNTRFGSVVADAKDFNGDGIDDVAITTNNQAYVVYGKRAPFDPSIRISDVLIGDKFVFEAGWYQSPYRIADIDGVSDVNNDGVTDLLISSPHFDGYARSGSVYVIYGSTTLPSTMQSLEITGNNGYHIFDDLRYSYNGFGHSVSDAGDFNNDGTNDFIVGERINNSDIYRKNGAAHVFFGNTLDVIDGVAPTINCPRGTQELYANSVLPNYIHFLSDVNDDCSYNTDMTYTQTPSAGTLFTGSTNVTITVIDRSGNTNSCMFTVNLKTTTAEIDCSTTTFSVNNLDGINGLILYGEKPHSETGRDVNTAGDVNGDGIDDFIVVAKGDVVNHTGPYRGYHIDVAGGVYIVFGTNSGFPPNIDLGNLNGSDGFKINNNNLPHNRTSDDNQFYKADTAGDINRDGFDDIILSEPFRGNSSGGIRLGYVYVIFGTNRGFSSDFDLSTLNGANGFTITGTDRNGFVGMDLDNLGDVNGDNIDDIILANIPSSPRFGAPVIGKCFVIFGTDRGFSPSFDLTGLNGTNGFVITSNGPTTEGVGRSIAGLGDVNGDNVNDIAIGGNKNRKFVVFGRSGSSSFPATLNVEDLNGTNGFAVEHSVATLTNQNVENANDVNNDGLNDIIFGNQYVLFGNSTFPAVLDLESLDGTNGFSFSRSGRVFSFAGDFNNDNYDDLIYGDFSSQYLIYGRETWQETISTTPSVSSYRVNIELLNNNDIVSASYAGDVNNDGIDDLVLGHFNQFSYNYAVNVDPGFAYVIFGQDIPDIDAPEITDCLSDQTLSSGSNLPDYTSSVRATDDCDTNLEITQSPEAGTRFTANTTVTITVTDNSGKEDQCTFEVRTPTPTVDLSVSSNTGTEDAGTVITVTATSSSAVVGDQTIDLAVTGTGITGTDFTLSNTTITILDGMTTGTVTFTIEDDALVESIETATLTISTPSSGITLGTITTQDVVITDNDLAICTIEAGEDQEIVEGQEIQLNAMVSNPGTLIWSPSRGLSNTNITDPIANPTETTTYTLLFTGTDGCTAEDMVTVFVTPLEEDQTRYGFSPDDDGINEYWEINGIDNYPNNKVLIYNRWGDLVFEVDGYNNTSRVFRGIANRKRSLGGDKLPEGTYFFDIKIEGAHNLKKETGFLVLKR